MQIHTPSSASPAWGKLGYMKRVHSEVWGKGEARKVRRPHSVWQDSAPGPRMNLRVGDITINERSSEGTQEEMKDVKSKGHPGKGDGTDALLQVKRHITSLTVSPLKGIKVGEFRLLAQENTRCVILWYF